MRGGFDRGALARVLADGVRELGLDLSDAQLAQLMDYLALMAKWNSVYNLTSLRDPMQMVTHHLLDSLAAVPAFAGAQNVLDVGAGGGLPGIVLAIARPGMNVSLIDTVHKKTAFLTQVKAELGLANVTVYTAKVQELQVCDRVGMSSASPTAGAHPTAPQKFDVITSRAFADLSDFVNWSGHLLADGGRFIALKGVAPKDERERLPGEWRARETRPLQVPGLGAERHLVFIERAEETI